MTCHKAQAQGQYSQPYYKNTQYFDTYCSAVRYYNPRLTSSQTRAIVQAILYYSDYYGLDPRLVTAVIACESAFNPKAVSGAGAVGLGQLMPATAKGEKTDPYNITSNIHGSCRVLCRNLKHYGDDGGYRYSGQSRTLDLALAAYNAGRGAVEKYGGIPPYPETQNYVKKVVAEYNRLCGRGG